MTASSPTARFDRALLPLWADWLAVAVAVALPWSTTAAGICIALWLLALLPTLNAAALRREITTPAGGLPVLLWALGLIGMAWADVTWTERFQGLDGFDRLLVIPLLLAQFRRSEHGRWVACGFLVSSAIVLIVSYVLVLTPGLSWRGHTVEGVPVHDDIFQNSDFLICGFGIIGYAFAATTKRYSPAVVALLALAALFFINFGLVVVSRSALVVAPVLVVLLGWRLVRWKGILAACVVGVVVAAAFWFASPGLRLRVHNSVQEFAEYRATDQATSLGMHAAFLTESLTIVTAAPVIGHGTGSIPEQFRRITAGESGAAAVATVNPHNQTFAVAIQLGLVGALALWAMWIAHLLLFRNGGVTAWIGTVVVVENIVSSTVHTHLFDFTHGWLYVFGVGVLGGTVLRERAAPVANAAPASAA
jgi:hypothetical protein